MIPKIIWQTHNYLYEDLPKSLEKCSKTWVNLNPGWEYRYTNHLERDSFIKSNYPELYNFYLKSNPITQADVWRMCVMYSFGGVYADMDSVCSKPLDYMLSDYQDYELITEPRYNEKDVNIAYFASAPKSKILAKVIKSMIRDKVKDPYWHVWLCFNKHVKDPEIAVFSGAIHSRDFKKNFVNYKIDYYGKKMSYMQYLKLL